VVYSRDGGRVAALHEDGQVNVFRVPAGGHPGSIFDTWSARLMEPEVHSYGPGNRYALLKYRDGEQHFYDFKEGREVNFGPIFADGGVLGEDWIDERSSLVIATAKTLFELSESGELNEKIAFPIVAEEVWVGDHLAYVVSAKRAYFYSIPDFKPIGSLDMIDDTKEFFVSSKKGLDFEVLDTGALGETPVTSLLNPPNAHTNSSKSYFTVARSKDWLETWILQQAESPGDLLAMANPKKIPIPSADWIDYSVTLDPPTIWINTGTYPRMNTTTSTTLSQADPFSGNVISRYQPPAAGWPETLWQVKTAFAVDNDRVAIFRYGQSDASSNSYIAGIWDRMGGQPKAWSKLGDSDVRYSNHVGQPEIKKNGEIAYVTLECEGRVDLVRLSDGSILMHKEIPSDVPLYPFLDISRRDVSNRVSNKFYDLIYRDAMARGVKFWSNVTTKKLPEALVRRLDEARARLH